MKDILKAMIFFKKKKSAFPSELPIKKSAPAPVKKSVKLVKSFQEITHTRVLTAEGWRRLMEKKSIKKLK